MKEIFILPVRPDSCQIYILSTPFFVKLKEENDRTLLLQICQERFVGHIYSGSRDRIFF